MIPINQQAVLVINRENGRQQLIAPMVVEALKTCTAFDSIENHTQRLCDTRPELRGQNSVVSGTLIQLADAGLMLEANTICERLNKPAARSLSSTRVFVITCDRPACVERLLNSMLAAGGLTAYETLCLVDDSKKPKNRQVNAALVEDFNRKSARDMRYFGEAEQEQILETLIRELPEHEVGIRFLIDPQRWPGRATYGRSRTLSLLLSVGYRAIVLDDDILCQSVRPAVPEDGVFVGSEGSREASFFSDRDSLLQAADLIDESPLDLHAKYLGSSLNEAIIGLKGGPLSKSDLSGANAAMTNIWRAESPILVSQCGSWGDPGTGSAHWTINLSEYSISRLLTAPGGVTHAIESRNAWLGSPRPTIMKMAFMSQMTGLDNSQLLPPYFPVFRGEDLLFASMVEAMHPRGAIIDQGFAVPHFPEQRLRSTLRDPMVSAGSVGLFSAYLTNQIDYTDGNDPGHRMKIIAEDLRRLAAKSSNDLLIDYRREMGKSHSMSLFRLSEQRRRTASMNSATWTGYLDRGIEELQGAIAREWSPTALDEAPKDATSESMIEGFRSLLNGYAAALDAWPAVRDRAQHCSPI
ncbi:MAG: hypothetical protein AAGI88_19405 [Pseudomonadota bacterium]